MQLVRTMGFLAAHCILTTQAPAEEDPLVSHKTLGLDLATDLAELTSVGSPQAAARDITDALMLGGGVGVSGAPGGVEDDRCARAGIEAIIDRLEF
jgi:hypothetical protein